MCNEYKNGKPIEAKPLNKRGQTAKEVHYQNGLRGAEKFKREIKIYDELEK